MDYDSLSVSELKSALGERDLSEAERETLLDYEEQHSDRKTAKQAIENAGD